MWALQLSCVNSFCIVLFGSDGPADGLLRGGISLGILIGGIEI